MLPDLIVPIFVSNLQSLEGAVDVITRAQARRKSLAYDRPPAAILPILSRFDSRTEYESAQEWLDISADRVKPFYSDWLPLRFSPRQALERTKLPYVAYFSFGETLPALTESVSDPESLAYALNAVSKLIEQQLGNAEFIMASSSEVAVATPPRDAPSRPVSPPTPAKAAVRLFLSYAEEDNEAAQQISEWLSKDGFEIFDWQNPPRTGGRFIEMIEEELQNADAFLALLSPSYLASTWCRRERELAIQREQDLQAAREPNRTFIYVLSIRETPKANAGFLRQYDWMDLTNPATRRAALQLLASRLGSRSEPGLARSGSRRFQPTSPTFRDREEELDKVLRGLTTPGGPHFWLVVAPPQLGKSWFLDRLGADSMLSGPGGWAIRRVDLRTEPPDLRNNAGALLARFFDRPSAESGRETLQAIALEIIRSGMPHLCLLDSAELLDSRTSATIRSNFSRIYMLVQEAARKGVRLAVIVASRREGEWRGVTPQPRVTLLPLTEFSVPVVEQLMRDLALDMERYFGPAELRRDAALVHQLTEGLPALLTRSLDWIREEEWLSIDRLDSQIVAEELEGTYIQDALLTQRSLLPEIQEPADDELNALEQALRVLTPYRLFTQSHLRHRLEEDAAFYDALARIPWGLANLWAAIGSTSLLKRPLNEPWLEIQPAIRRLLFRYYYKSAEHRSAAHSEAQRFVRVWAEQEVGKEQVIALVECLWHEAVMLNLRHSAEMEQKLCESAKVLSYALRSSSAYTVEELRGYAADLMMNDEEFQEAISNIDGLLSRLIEIVMNPLP